MTPRLMLLPLAFALVAAVTFANGEGEEAVAAEKEMVRDPATGEMVTAPEYGGTLTFGTALGAAKFRSLARGTRVRLAWMVLEREAGHRGLGDGPDSDSISTASG